MSERRLQIVRKVSIAVVATLIVAAPVAAETFYTLTPIHVTEQRLYTVATGISANGTIVGYGTSWDAPEAGFMYDAHGMHDLGEFIPNAVNDNAAIVGWQLAKPLGAFVWTNGSATEIRVPGAYGVAVAGIDPAGNVVGCFQPTSRGPWRAFEVLDGSFHDLGILDKTSSNTTCARALGSSREIVGASGIGGRSPHAFLWSDGHLTDLGTLGGSVSDASDINPRGEIVGSSLTEGNSRVRAFIYSDGSMRDLGAPPGDSFASAINATGEVVGHYTNDEGRHIAFIYARGVLRDLAAQIVSGFDGQVYDAVAINDAGQIAANACSGDMCFAVRLDPIPDSDRVAIEYHHAEFDHYFITADTGEIAKLDQGFFAGWARTGQVFAVAPMPRGGTALVCRFFSTSFGAKSSHFYTASPEECAYVKSNLARDWTFEGVVFSIGTPDAAGACPSGTIPVYRTYNNGQGGAPNHRYTTSIVIRGQMLAAGWIPEGHGELGVSMCALA